MNSLKSAVFLDRDGVLTKGVDLISKYEELELEENAADAIRIFNKLGFKVIVVTNQPQIARGICSEEDVINIHNKLKDALKKEGALIDDFYFCPHHPEMHDDVPKHALKYRIDCDCRKPKPGMIFEAAKKHSIDLSKSFFIGDRTVDILAGKNAGTKTILVKTGMAGSDAKYDVNPDFTCENLYQAAKLIERNTIMKAVILAGGKGERLMPLTKDIPKPMIKIEGKPILEYSVELLKKYGITEIIICGSYLTEKIKTYFGDGSKFGVRIYYPEEKEMLGTGGAIKNAASYIEGAENILVLNGDQLFNINLSKFFDFHEMKNGLATLMVRETDHPFDSDALEMDKNSRVVKHIGTGQDKIKLANAGVMIFKTEILKYIPTGVSNKEKDVVFKLLESHRIYGYLSDEYIRDIGTFERLEKARKEFPKFYKSSTT